MADPADARGVARPRPVVLIAVALAALVVPATAWALRPSAREDAAVSHDHRSGRAPITFGIYPGGAAGTVGPAGETRPEDPAARIARLEELRGSRRPFVLHLYDAYRGPGDAAALPPPLAEEIDGYLARDFQVELVLTYRPSAPAGDVYGFVDYVRSRVRQLGPRPGVTSLQVTNEVNVDGAPSAADGAYPGARDALVRGVIAAKDEARRGGFAHLRIGFNWAYQLDPAEEALWRRLGADGGAAFAAAVDWVGLDVYPGTWGPRLRGASLGSGARRATLDALSTLRHELLPLAGLEHAALHVSEAGYPTGPGRGPRRQARVLRAVMRAIAARGGDFGVTDFRWFNLRDADSSSSSFESQYGLLRDDYRPKPAFATYRRIIARQG